MIAFNNMCVTLGQLVSYGLGAGFTEVIHGWRFLVAVGGIPPVVLSFLLPFCPETPRQLICHSKIEEAKRVIARVYPHATPEQVDGKAMHIQKVIQDEARAMADKSVWWQFKQLHCVPSNLRALISACTVMASK
jgi:SP family myo-inositol transporter-like MFS transporter 13